MRVNVAIKNSRNLPLADLSSNLDIGKIMHQSITDVIRKYRTEVKKALRTRTALPASVLNPRIKAFPPSRKSLKLGELRGVIWVGTNRVPVMKTLTAGSYIRAGAGAAVVGSKTKDKYSLQRSSFLAAMPSGHVGIFARTPKAKTSSGRDSRNRPRKNRLPIEELMFKFDNAAEDIMTALLRDTTFVEDVENLFFRKLEQYA